MNLRLSLLRCGLAVVLLATTPPMPAASDPRDEPQVRIGVVFFPPTPPVYGARIPERPAPTRLRVRGHGLTPPDGLADFAGEILFPPLSTRLYSGSLPRALEVRIEAYRTKRNALLGELLDRCVILHEAPDDAREREFRAFGVLQTPAIAALEAEADALRAELSRNRLGLDTGWNVGRGWKLDSFPANREWMNLEAEFQVVRAAAFYDDGLTPAQRGLVRELALELERPARKARGEPLDHQDSDALFFSPETARLRLPPDLPAPVLERVAAYNRRKSVLKQQLREAIRRQEGASRAERAAAYARLADEQWPQLCDLESLAEELRADLAPRFVPVPPEKPPAIPAWLVDVIHRYNEDRDTFFGDLRQKAREALEALPRPERHADSDQRIRLDDEYAQRRRDTEQQVLREFQAANAARFAALEKRYHAIRTALEEIARTTPHAKTGRPLSVEMLLQEHTAAMAEFDRFGRASAIYSNYRTAMLQRGLSPEQRRLLFSYAVVGLAQPLPFGEPLPRRTFKYPIPR